jgi:hypothetical protein
LQTISFRRGRAAHGSSIEGSIDGRADELIPKRSEDPRVTSSVGDADSLKALDLNPPNREEPNLWRSFSGNT